MPNLLYISFDFETKIIDEYCNTRNCELNGEKKENDVIVNIKKIITEELNSFDDISPWKLFDPEGNSFTKTFTSSKASAKI